MQVGIVAHHRRAAAAERLAVEVTANHVHMDFGDAADTADGCRRALAGHLAVLEWMYCNPVGTWCVVLEDDAVAAPRFRHTLNAALRYTPSLLVGLYLGTGNPSGEMQRQIQPVHLRAQACGAAWLTADWFTASVGYAVHRSRLGSLISALRTTTAIELPLAVTRWSQDLGIATSYTRPSLVDHRDTDSVVYPQGHSDQLRRLPRRAWSFGRHESWHTRVLPIGGHIPPWSAWDGCNECVRTWAQHGFTPPATTTASG